MSGSSGGGWVRVDTKFPDHPKVLDIGPIAEALWLRGLCYAGEHLTDGFVPDAFVRRMNDMKATAVAGRLVAAGLWHQVEGGYTIHDYLPWQRSKAEIEEGTSKRAAAGRKGGKQKASNALANASPELGDYQTDASGLLETSASKTLPEREEEKETETDTRSIDPYGSQEREPPSDPPEPFDLLETLCDEIGSDPSVLSKGDKGKQLSAGKRLVAGGATVDEVRRLTRYLLCQSWVTSGVDLLLVESQFGKWRLNGRPDAPPRNVVPLNGNGRSEGRYSDVFEQLRREQRGGDVIETTGRAL